MTTITIHNELRLASANPLIISVSYVVGRESCFYFQTKNLSCQSIEFLKAAYGSPSVHRIWFHRIVSVGERIFSASTTKVSWDDTRIILVLRVMGRPFVDVRHAKDDS